MGSAVTAPTWRLRTTQLAVALLLLALAAWSGDFLFGVFNKYRHIDAATYTMFWERRGWLWIHLAGGGLTILLGLVQFLSQWPRACNRLHRWSGRVYLCGMLIACTGATGLIATSPAPFSIRAAFAATALAWLCTALAGLVSIRRGRVMQHRRWMIRTYLVTLAPVTFRLLLHTPGIFSVLPPPPAGIAWLLWNSWVLPLALCELVWRLGDLARPLHPTTAAAVTVQPQSRM